MIPSILGGMARPAKITWNNKFAKSLQYLKKEVRNETDFLCRWASQFSINWYYHFWWLWPGIPKLLKIIGMQCLCNISRKHWVMKWKSYKLIVFFFYGFAQACPKYPGKFAIFWWHLKKEVRNKVWPAQILLLQFIIHPVFPHHWPFSSRNMEPIPIPFSSFDCLFNISS